MADHQHAVIGLGRIDHGLGVGQRGRDRLLHQHMDARVQQGHAQFGVIAVRRGDDGGVQTGGDEGLGGRYGGRPIGGGHALGRHGVGIEDGRQLDIAQFGQNAGVVAAHDAGAGDADLERGLMDSHADQALKLATAAMMRSCVWASRSACIGRLTTTSFSRSVTGRPPAPRG
ncbi:hypothetical protein D3C73_1231000 [compost metagenome]